MPSCVESSTIVLFDYNDCVRSCTVLIYSFASWICVHKFYLVLLIAALPLTRIFGQFVYTLLYLKIERHKEVKFCNCTIKIRVIFRSNSQVLFRDMFIESHNVLLSCKVNSKQTSLCGVINSHYSLLTILQ